MAYIYRILILDDEEALRRVISKRLRRKDYEVLEAGSLRDGLVLLQNSSPDAVFLDLRLPDGTGLDFLKEAKRLQTDTQIIMLTGHGTIESAIEAMKLGAYDYLTKPCNLSELEITLEKAIERKRLLNENSTLRQVLSQQTSDIRIVGESKALGKLLELTKKVANCDEPVLIQGESGSGKELIARAVHYWSPRKTQAFIPLNCGALPETLIESELFGYEKGAFTGAGNPKTGLVEMADSGTLFLDEIGEMPLSLQVKLLRFLETGEFRRVGDNRLRRVDVRIVAATNRNLQHEINQEHFRQDFYFRLNALTLDVPPLRKRKEDIIPLAEYFLSLCKPNDTSQSKYSLTEEAKEQLLNYNYPGNVRELYHLIKCGQILAAGGTIRPEDIWPERINPSFEQNIDNLNCQILNEFIGKPCPPLDELERMYILSTLKKVNGNRAQAAKLLGMSVRNLYRKLETYAKNEVSSSQKRGLFRQ